MQYTFKWGFHKFILIFGRQKIKDKKKKKEIFRKR
jgi:hypothetical protein